MVVSKDRKWVICTPKKTGTHSLNAVLCDKTNYAQVISPWHGRTWNGNGVRILIVRHPIERFVSMYYFVKRVRSAWLKRYDTSFNEWANQFFNHPIEVNPDWRLNLCGYEQEFQPHCWFKTENLQGCLDYLIEKFGYILPSVPHHYRTKDRPSVMEAWDQLTSLNKASLARWAAPDLRRYDYAFDFS